MELDSMCTPTKTLRSSDKNQVTSKTTYMNENVGKQRHLLYPSVRRFFFALMAPALGVFFLLWICKKRSVCSHSFGKLFYILFIPYHFWLDFFLLKFTHNGTSIFLHCLELMRFQGSKWQNIFHLFYCKHLFAFDPQ